MTALVSAKEARACASRIRAGMRTYLETLGDVAKAYRERHWESLGYESWEAYYNNEFSEERVRLTPEMRDKAIRELRIAGMSKATFARQFRRHAGKPFSAFVNQVRLDAACRELVATNTSVSEAAFASGFNSLSYFNRSFRQAHKCSPKEYRRKAAR